MSNMSENSEKKETRLEEGKMSRQKVLQTLIDVADNEVKLHEKHTGEWRKLRDKALKELSELRQKDKEGDYIICATCKWVKFERKKKKKGVVNIRAHCEHVLAMKNKKELGLRGMPVLRNYVCERWEKREKKEEENIDFTLHLNEVIETKMGVVSGDLCPTCRETWDECYCKPKTYEEYLKEVEAGTASDGCWNCKYGPKGGKNEEYCFRCGQGEPVWELKEDK